MTPVQPNVPDAHVDEFAFDLHQTCGAFQVEPDWEQPRFRGQVVVDSCGGLDLTSVSQNTQHIQRTAREIKHDPGDHFFLILQQTGTSQLAQDAGMQQVLPGDMYVVDNTQPSCFQYNGHVSQQLSVHLPRDEQLHRFGKRISGGVHIDRTDSLGQALRAILTSIQSRDVTRQLPVAEAFYSVLGAYLVNRADGNRAVPDPKQVLVQRALDLMARHYRDPEFSLQHIAQKLNVSLRHLQRAFHASDDTLQARMQRLRLDAAHRMIQERPANAKLTVTEVAFACGYADLSTFHRQFRARYKTSPGAALRRCRDMP